MSNYRRKYKLYPKTLNKKCIRFAFLQVIIIEKKKEKKNGRESYVSFYTQYGVSSRFLAKRRYFRSTFWSTLYMPL